MLKDTWMPRLSLKEESEMKVVLPPYLKKLLVFNDSDIANLIAEAEAEGDPNDDTQLIDVEQPDGCWDEVIYPEFFWWREDHNIEQEPPPYLTSTDTRCPRCYSTHITISEPDIRCENCGYSEELFDFPVAHRYEGKVK